MSSSTNFAESMSQSITNIVTNTINKAQDFLWRMAEINAQIWLWMPLWLELTILGIALIILAGLMKQAWKNRSFWIELIQGKF